MSRADATRRRRHLPSRRLAAGLVGAVLLSGGGTAIAVAATSQQHAPQPTRAQSGRIGPARPASHPTGKPPGDVAPATTSSPTTGPSAVHGPLMAPSPPVSIAIPAIGVRSAVFDVGLNPDGTVQTPPLDHSPLTNEAAWYRYSSTPGALGTSVIEGHIDSAADGPSVFYRLGALVPGQTIYVTRRDHTVAVFQVTGVRQYPKDEFPTVLVYGSVGYAALRLVTCGGSFDYSTHHYLSNTVVYAALISAQPGSSAIPGG